MRLSNPTVIGRAGCKIWKGSRDIMDRGKIEKMSKAELTTRIKNAERFVRLNKNEEKVADAKLILSRLEDEMAKRSSAIRKPAKGLPEGFYWVMKDNTGDRTSRLINGEKVSAEIRQDSMHAPTKPNKKIYSSYINGEFFRHHESVGDARLEVTEEIAKNLQGS